MLKEQAQRTWVKKKTNCQKNLIKELKYNTKKYLINPKKDKKERKKNNNWGNEKQ